MIRWLARLAGVTAAVGSGLTLVRLRDKLSIALLFVPKMAAGGLSLVWFLLGAFATVFGLIKRDRVTSAVGLFGAFAAARHILITAKDHNTFEETLGPGWDEGIWGMGIDRYVIPPQPLRSDVRGKRNVVYDESPSTGKPLLCDLWHPPDDVEPSGVAVVYLHGGGWAYMDKGVLTDPFFKRLAGQGHLVMDVAYTLTPEATVDVMMDDVKRAVAYLKTHAQEFGLQPDKIVLCGGSAGGHLALLAAYAPGEFAPEGITVETSVAGVIAYYPIVDLAQFHRWASTTLGGVLNGDGSPTGVVLNYARQFTGITTPMIDMAELVPTLTGGSPDALWRCSPINHVGPHCPPTLIFRGASDTAVKREPIQAMMHRLQVANVPAFYVEFAETEHAFDLFYPRISPSAQSATYDTERFLSLIAQNAFPPRVGER